MYKLFEIIYNSGDWNGYHSNFFIAKNKEEVMKKSKVYQDYHEQVLTFGGDLFIKEVNFDKQYKISIENIQDFNLTLSIIKKNQ